MRASRSCAPRRTIAAGENASLIRFPPCFELGALDCRAAERHQDRRHQRDAPHHRARARFRRAGRAALRLSRPGFLASLHLTARCGDVLVERLGIDLEASPFGPVD
jgi:hypothetical protein